jgi:hypothetical protein
MLQTAKDLQAAAHFNNTVEFVIEKFGPLSNDKMTGEICVLTSWRWFDEAENTVEPIYEKMDRRSSNAKKTFTRTG